jgi:protoporphyrinogen oxidase
MEICIIGGGLTGLSAAYALSREHRIHLFERDTALGGCLASYEFPNYFIEKFYHHCFTTDHTLFQLLSELQLLENLEWRIGATGYYIDKKICRLSNPIEILRYPYLSLTDKARLALLTLRAKNMDIQTLDHISARDYIVEHLGIHAYESFFEPLLKSKFGEMREKVSAAWLISRIAIRSHRGVSGECLGYLTGGFHTLIKALESKLGQCGCIIQKNTPITALSKQNCIWNIDGRQYDAVLSTIPPHELQRIGGPAFPAVIYQGAACMTLGLDHDVTTGIYWLNLKDAAPYGAVISHTNFIPVERYGEHIVYLASYFTGSPPPSLESHILSDFCDKFSIRKESIHWHKLAIDPWAGPIYKTGYRNLIIPYEKDGLYMAGMFSEPNYPERSMEGSIRAGFEVAQKITRGASE